MRTPVLLAACCLVLAAADWPVEPAADAPWDRSIQGVELQDVVVGQGEMVVDRSEVEVHYVGMLEDGTVFDASRPRGSAFGFRVGAGQVIPGWEEGLLGMRVGGTRRLVIPPELGYGPRGQGSIPPNSTLYFEVELLAVEAPRVPPQAPSAVADGAWKAIGDLLVADVVKGSGKKIKVKAGKRACVDYASFDAEGRLLEHTWLRARCTWYALADEDLKPEVEEGLRGMRGGGTRVIRAGDVTWEVVLDSVGF